jgi:hypothetical protein
LRSLKGAGILALLYFTLSSNEWSKPQSDGAEYVGGGA